MWGTQVMQRLAREIRTAENTIVQAEKMASYAKLYLSLIHILHECERWRRILP